MAQHEQNLPLHGTLPTVGLAAQAPAAVAGARRLRLVVAEDDADLRRFLVSSLTSAGHEVAEAHHGLDLLDLLMVGEANGSAGVGFDVVVTDQHMPGLTGLGVIEALHRLNYPAPTVLMSAFVDDDLLARATALGVAVLSKPFDISLLFSAVERARETPASVLSTPNTLTQVP
jgi:CheY-like chemotaxis protein